MLTYLESTIFGMVQGITELFPISSLGHSVLLPKLAGWSLNENDPFFLTFLVATHAATATVLFFYFFSDWKNVIKGFFRSLKEREIKESDVYAKMAWLLIIGTIPAGVLGLLFEEPLKKLFALPNIVAAVLILNGLMLLGAEFLRRNQKKDTEKGSDERISKLTWAKSIQVGLLQSVALFPGFSRTGASITGGLFVGLSHEDSARFSFLLATPVIGAAAVLKLPELLNSQEQASIGPIITGSIFAAIFAYLSVRFLTKYFQTKTLTPFGIYCILMGIASTLLFFLR